MKKIIQIIFMLFFVVPQFVSAGINYRTGNFYISYTDIEFSQSNTITRTYNSKSVYNGLFGFGWGSQLDTRLFLLPDGNLAVQYYGGGSLSLFSSPITNKQATINWVNELVGIELKNNKLDNEPLAISKRKSDLLNDMNKRTELWIRLFDQGDVKRRRPTAAKQSWMESTEHRVIWENGKYTVSWTNDKYFFDADGNIIEQRVEDDHKIFKYLDGRLSKIITDRGVETFVTLDSSGRIIKLNSTDSGKTSIAIFTYNASDNLTYSKDVEANEYWFEYDNSHNMVKIRYTDSTSLKIDYDPLSYFAIKITERNGSYKTYDYKNFTDATGNMDDLHYSTEIKSFDDKGKLTFTSYHEFENRMINGDRIYLFRTLSKSDTSYLEAVYDPISEMAVYINKDKKEAWAKYDAKGRPVYARVGDSVLKVQYNLVNRVVKFMAIDSVKKDSITYSYNYSPAGELIQTEVNGIKYKIEGNKKKQVKLSGKEIVLVFTYNEDEEMTAVDINGLGKIDIQNISKSPKPIVDEFNKLKYAVSPSIIDDYYIWRKTGY